MSQASLEFSAMGSLLSIFILLLSISLLTSPPHLFASADSSLIHNVCKNTNYNKFCLSSLKSNSSSLKADTKGLAVIMIGIGMRTANQTNSFLSSQLLANTNDSLIKKVVQDCADKYSHAMDALHAAVEELNSMSVDYAYVQVTAAKDYPNACHNGYKRFPGLAYPVELAHREQRLEHICDVALGIIDFLGWN